MKYITEYDEFTHTALKRIGVNVTTHNKTISFDANKEQLDILSMLKIEYEKTNIDFEGYKIFLIEIEVGEPNDYTHIFRTSSDVLNKYGMEIDNDVRRSDWNENTKTFLNKVCGYDDMYSYRIFEITENTVETISE